jgi:hypothetical protein
MSAPTEAVAQLVDAVTVHSLTAYSWLGERTEATTPEGPPAPADARRSLTEQLAARLYSDFYCLGSPGPAAGWSEQRRQPWPSPAVLALAEANVSNRTFSEGWTFIEERDGMYMVARDGLCVAAHPDQVAADSEVPATGAQVQVLGPKEHIGRPYGFYTAYGERQPSDPTPDRFYWNVAPGGRAALIGAVTRRLNRRSIPFRVKVANDADTPRADAGVLYTDRAWRDVVLGELPAVWGDVEPHLRAATPAFTRVLVRGLSFAESPPGLASFGTHRCELVADGLVRGFEHGAHDQASRLAIVASTFAEHGLSLDRAHLNPASADLPAVHFIGA